VSGDLAKLKTWAGLPASDIADRLRTPFEDPRAYKTIHGGTAGAARLTDIETAWMIERVNEVFGPYGLGWVLDWRPEDVILLSEDSKRQTVAVKRAEFRYILIDENGNERTCVAPCCGGSQNELPFALKGMQTNCIGNALSKLRFQELVYKGLLNHENAGGGIRTTGERAEGETRPEGGVDRSRTGAKGGRVLDGGDPESLEYFVIPVGKHRGERLVDVDVELVEWYASKMKPTTEAAGQLQAAARAYLQKQGQAG
jgi:hypothetical protein